MLTASPVTRVWPSPATTSPVLQPGPNARARRQLGVQVGEGLAHLGRRAHGAQRVVLVDGGDPEDGHDRVADVLLDGAAVPLDHRGHSLEVASHQRADRLGVERLAERRRVDDVREQHGHRLPGQTGHVPSLGPAALRLPCALVFDSLSDRLQGALGDLRKRGRLDEEAISSAMREIRLALLEADVNLQVVRDFVARVRERALGEEVLKSLTPGQQVVKIVNDELTELIGSSTTGLALRQVRDRDPARRPPGLGQDDDRRQARAAPAQGGSQARPDRRRPPAPGGDRPARAARQARSTSRSTVPTRRTRSRRRARARARARGRLDAVDRRHRRAACRSTRS